jgi:hypothetical protein
MRRVDSAAFSFDRNDSKGTPAIATSGSFFVETFIASVQIEEAKLSHANIPRFSAQPQVLGPQTRNSR